MAITELTDANAAQYLSADGIVVIDCQASWCGPCRQFAPIYTKVAATYPQGVVPVVFASLDTQQYSELAEALEIAAIPTVVMVRDGIEIFRRVGVLTASALREVIDKAVALDMDIVREKRYRQQHPPAPTMRF